MRVSLDTLFTAETPEGIALALRPAGVVARFYAFAIDTLIRAALVFIAMAVLSALGRLGLGLFLIVYFLLEWFYPVVFELTLAGATPGKRALGLKVVMDTGLPVTPAASLARNLLRAADFMPVAYGFGLAAMLMRSDFKRLGDMAAGTLVVHARAISLHGPLPSAEPAAPARPLAPREQAAVIAWAGRSTRLTEARHAELAQLAAPAIAAADSASHDARPRLLGVAQWLLGRR
ncbi:RDD family protein [Piscinibacter sp.]|uniref:RDD family protein n=1 Tax=Piscinibacter sp. TaxID=1903157 RepID=UPI002CE8819F|nr:RDD family protein [Albitalea sp.]HUG24104.1 RDD family protein [Albitalea sp.]